MNFSSTLQAEIQILKNLITYYEKSEDEHASSLVIAYKHGLQALLHVYEASQQTEHIPF